MRGKCRKLHDAMSETDFTVERILLGKASRIWRDWKLVIICGETVDTGRMLVGRAEGKVAWEQRALMEDVIKMYHTLKKIL